MVKMRTSASKATDLRLKIINELVSGIRTIRAYAWETPLMNKIVATRNIEIKRYAKLLCLRGFILGLTRYIGLLIFLPLVLIKVLAEDGISAGEAYSLYGLVLFIGFQSIAVFTFALQSYSEFVAFMSRLGEVMRLSDYDPPLGYVTANEKNRVIFDKVSSSWGFQDSLEAVKSNHSPQSKRES